MLLFLDTETGGLRPGKHALLQVGLAAYHEGKVVDRLTLNIRQKEYLVTPGAMAVNQINLKDLYDSGTGKEATVKLIKEFVGDVVIKYGLSENPMLVGHNIDFDRRFLMALFDSVDQDIDDYLSYKTLDTAGTIRILKEAGKLPEEFPTRLHKAVRFMGYEPVDEHTAQGDIDTTIFLYEKLLDIIFGKYFFTKHEDKWIFVPIPGPRLTPSGATPQ